MLHYFRHSDSVIGTIFQGFSVIILNKYRFDFHCWKKQAFNRTFYNRNNHSYGIVLGQIYICGRLF